MVPRIWALAFVLIFIAVLLPIGINAFNNSDEIARNQSFVASGTEDQVFNLTFTPVKTDSELVKIDGATAVADSDYTIVYLTGVITVASTSIDSGDPVTVAYVEALNFGGVSPLWTTIPIFILLAVVYSFWKRKGSR